MKTKPKKTATTARKQYLQSIALLGLSLGVVNCAGPTTPLGALWATNPGQIKMKAAAYGGAHEAATFRIWFDPPRQVFHTGSHFTIKIDDPSGIDPDYKLAIRYNGVDVTEAFLLQSYVTLEKKGYQLKIHMPLLRLDAEKEHAIEVVYSDSSGLQTYARYKSPLCSAFGHQPLLSTGQFITPQQMLQLINRHSKEMGFSPAFTAALIAQESSFNPRRVSWNKAMGLTQITTIADTELTGTFSSWPRYPGLTHLPAPWVKILVLNGHINQDNEWRLNPERSVKGGLTFAQNLASRWNSPEHKKRIAALFSDPDIAQTKLLLASYHSGYARVATAFSRHGVFWMKAPELKEARKYVNRVFSYCDAFSSETRTPEVDYENET